MGSDIGFHSQLWHQNDSNLALAVQGCWEFEKDHKSSQPICSFVTLDHSKAGSFGHARCCRHSEVANLFCGRLGIRKWGYSTKKLCIQPFIVIILYLLSCCDLSPVSLVNHRFEHVVDLQIWSSVLVKVIFYTMYQIRCVLKAFLHRRFDDFHLHWEDTHIFSSNLEVITSHSHHIHKISCFWLCPFQLYVVPCSLRLVTRKFMSKEIWTSSKGFWLHFLDNWQPNWYVYTF